MVGRGVAPSRVGRPCATTTATMAEEPDANDTATMENVTQNEIKVLPG